MTASLWPTKSMQKNTLDDMNCLVRYGELVVYMPLLTIRQTSVKIRLPFRDLYGIECEKVNTLITFPVV
jgi:hypothetical protein